MGCVQFYAPATSHHQSCIKERTVTSPHLAIGEQIDKKVGHAHLSQNQPLRLYPRHAQHSMCRPRSWRREKKCGVAESPDRRLMVRTRRMMPTFVEVRVRVGSNLPVPLARALVDASGR
jgi:hypothetical protein